MAFIERAAFFVAPVFIHTYKDGLAGCNLPCALCTLVLRKGGFVMLSCNCEAAC